MKTVEVKSWVVAVTYFIDPGWFKEYTRHLSIRYVDAIDKEQAELAAEKIIKNKTDGRAERIMCLADELESDEEQPSTESVKQG